MFPAQVCGEHCPAVACNACNCRPAATNTHPSATFFCSPASEHDGVPPREPGAAGLGLQRGPLLCVNSFGCCRLVCALPGHVVGDGGRELCRGFFARCLLLRWALAAAVGSVLLLRAQAQVVPAAACRRLGATSVPIVTPAHVPPTGLATACSGDCARHGPHRPAGRAARHPDADRGTGRRLCMWGRRLCMWQGARCSLLRCITA